MISVTSRNLIIEWRSHRNINFLLTFFIKKNACAFITAKVNKGVDLVTNRLKRTNFSGLDTLSYFISRVYWLIPTSLWFLHVKPPPYFLACRVPVAGIEAFERVKGKWFCLTRTSSNFFSSEGMGAVSFPLKVRLTSIMNEQLEATIGALKNDVVINSDVQFSDTKVRGKRYTCQYVLSLFIGLIDFFNPSWFYSSLVMFWLGRTL